MDKSTINILQTGSVEDTLTTLYQLFSERIENVASRLSMCEIVQVATDDLINLNNDIIAAVKFVVFLSRGVMDIETDHTYQHVKDLISRLRMCIDCLPEQQHNQPIVKTNEQTNTKHQRKLERGRRRTVKQSRSDVVIADDFTAL